MKRLAWILCFALLCLMALPPLSNAQTGSPPIFAGIEVRPVFTSHAITFKGEQVSSSFRKEHIEIAGGILAPNLFRLKYVVIPGINQTETITPTGIVKVGATEFGQKPMSGGGQQPQGQQAKPLDIEWSFQGEHRLELTGLIRFPIQPVVIADLTNLQVSATGEKNGKIVTDNESLNKFFAGFGGVLSYADHYTHVDVLAVVGPKFNRVEANALYRLSEHAAVGGGYFLETKWFDSDTRVRAQGPFIEVVWAF